MARITREEVERVANLARLDLDEEEALRMTAEFEAFLAHVESLQDLDTREIEPTSHPIPIPTPMREDRVVAGLAPAVAVANAPAVEDTVFRVPKVIEGGEG